MNRLVHLGIVVLLSLIVGYILFVMPFYMLHVDKQNRMEIQNNQEISRFLETH